MAEQRASRARRAATPGALVSIICLASGCGAATVQPRVGAVQQAREGAVQQPRAASRAPRAPRLSLIVAIGTVGAFSGRCDPAAHVWTLEFRDTTGVDDLVYVRIAAGRVRRSDVPPGGQLSWHLVPGAARSREPADSISGTSATTIPSTRPLRLVISQGSEPHIYRVDATLALAAAIGDTTDCALVASDVKSLTYFNGGAPSIP